MLIVIEGIDGSGKSTLIENLKNHFIRARQGEEKPDCSFFYEPTKESVWGQKIRKILNDPTPVSSDTNQELLELYLKDRYWDIENNIRPTLEQGKTVFLDRYYFSTAAYQAEKNLSAARIIQDYLDDPKILQPDLLFYLDIQPQNAFRRIQSRGSQKQIFEYIEVLERIYDNYAYILREFTFSFPVFRIDSSQSEQTIIKEVLKKV